MRAVNLHFLTRTHEQKTVSQLLKALSGREDRKEISPHEAATLWSLADRIAAYLGENAGRFSDDWLSLLDGFYFSYVIEHIGKEFDLLKISADGGCILNIELKSEKVEEERIRKQLEQNRYYLSHIAHTIYSFTYVMETDLLYTADDSGVLRKCEMEELASVLGKEELNDYLPEGIENCFRTAEYLISPVANPEKFLEGKYFLTNQQADFKRRILGFLQEREPEENNPVIAVSGIAGTGKTLLLLDLARELSQKHRVLFIHSGPLRRGHIEIGRKLENADIIGEEELSACSISDAYGYVLVDEADHLDAEVLDGLLAEAGRKHIPVILSYDPHHLLLGAGEKGTGREELSDTARLIEKAGTLALSFTGNIRINRPVYSFLRVLLYLRERASGADYSCIDVLYADTAQEQRLLKDYFRRRGYVLVSRSGGDQKEDDVIAREYDRVMMVMDDSFYYDETLHLRTKEGEEEALRLLYEGLSRTREKLCLLVTGNRDLFAQILSIRLNH